MPPPRLDSYIGPALGGNPLLADRDGLETLLRNGPGTDAGGRRATGRTQQIDALVAYTKQFAKGGS